jgi:hypothetical protein
MAALRNARVEQARNDLVACLKTICNDQAIRILLADGINRRACHFSVLLRKTRGYSVCASSALFPAFVSSVISAGPFRFRGSLTRLRLSFSNRTPLWRLAK